MYKKIGFIGLGNMGSGMSKNLLKKEGELLVWDLIAEKRQELTSVGANVAQSNREVMESCDVVFLSLPGPIQVKSVVAGEDGLLKSSRPGQYIVDLSTVDPTTSVEMAESSKKMEVVYVDIPVSGGMAGAAAGTLTLMAGATKEEIENAGLINYLMDIGTAVYYMEERGLGSAIKLINNFIAFTTLAVDGEAILMADHLGLKLDKFFEVVLNSSGGSPALQGKAQKIMNDDIEPGFALNLVLKDLELARQLCQDCGIANYSLNQAIQFYRMAQQRGYGMKDTSSVIKMIRELEPMKSN